MNKLKNNPNAEWHKWPDEVPELDGREIHSYLVRGIGGIDNKLHHWICEYVETNDHTLKGWFLCGNEFREQNKGFQYMDVDELYSVEVEEEEEIPKFFDFCKDYILDKIDEYEGMKVYGSNLGDLITEGMNNDGSFVHSKVEAKRYLEKWFLEAGGYLEYEKQVFGQRSNPLDRIESFLVLMVIDGVRVILSRCEFVKDRTDKAFFLTNDVIDVIAIIKEQVAEQTDDKLF